MSEHYLAFSFDNKLKGLGMGAPFMRSRYACVWVLNCYMYIPTEMICVLTRSIQLILNDMGAHGECSVSIK